MSFCRFSTDDFQCDLYCYESDAGYETIVANNRPRWKVPLPPPVELERDTIAEFVYRTNTVSEMLNHPAMCELKPIGLPHDGAHFCDKTPQEWADTLQMLKDVGYQFPFELIEEARAGDV